jgi:hypothetical protein
MRYKQLLKITMLLILVQENHLSVEQALWLRWDQINLDHKVVETTQNSIRLNPLFWQCYEQLRKITSPQGHSYIFI